MLGATQAGMKLWPTLCR
ncbi:hypothetical protein E2C01_079264 [Portunus trituberculatus]|uniref:Uncharacterized protein n=1 Tax=Portunus trituberculatus TaxID=210409 RepID=A0A5B7IPV2_PORTR|nr:hypothetical protein [Portunus trituberculatus]